MCCNTATVVIPDQMACTCHHTYSHFYLLLTIHTTQPRSYHSAIIFPYLWHVSAYPRDLTSAFSVYLWLIIHFLLTMNKLDLKLAAFSSLVSCARLCDARDYFITCLVSQPTLRASNLFCHSLGRLNSKDTDAIARPCSIYADAQITCFALRLSGNAYELLRNFKGTTCVP